ncbi:hypothetical protein UlMin_017190 [Ulmus minor]
MANKQFYIFTIFTLIVLVNGQDDQLSGFISIDCGASENSVDETTGIAYTADANFTDAGEIKEISAQFNSLNIQQQYRNVRSFPQGAKNCYILRPSQGKNRTYLFRAGFMYGDYDGKNQLPEFDLYVGVNLWKNVVVDNSSSIITMEMIHVIETDYVHVCLVNTGSGTPFISVLEVRLLNNNAYVSEYGSLDLYARLDCGLSPKEIVRYKADPFDRIWSPFNYKKWDVLSTSSAVDPYNVFAPPSLVMSTAVRPQKANESLGFTWTNNNNSIDNYYICMHFAEVENLTDDQTREMTIYINDEKWYGPFVPQYLQAISVHSTRLNSGSTFQVWINKTENSTLQPILNAFEIFTVKQMLQLQTDQDDIDAIMNIKSTYKLNRSDWQGDPCAPSAYIWEGLNCTSSETDPPRIIFLNLSSSGLAGEITPYISDLSMIQILDLSNNHLSGTVPDFLSQMSSLKVLNLGRNNFSGTIPIGLQEKSSNGSLLLSADGNSFLCLKTPCEINKSDKKTNKVLNPVVASVGGIVVLFLTAGAIFLGLKKNKPNATATTKVNAESIVNNNDEDLEIKKQHLTYSEILSITNNFERIIGKGGFGTVYHGYLNNSQVAVKMLSPSSAQGYKQFHAEAKLLTRVHHKNLTALVGYCDEGSNVGLVYEYMAHGDLSWHLSNKNSHPLTWEERLKIAMDAAQGLEYLHSGCKPPIVHRDVKTTNILLNDKLQAKLSDFGLSRAFPLEGHTHVSTVVVGTPGYLDPEYLITNRLTEKSDVFSFGVMLLEIITGRLAITKNNGKDHVIEWVKFRLSSGDIESIVDPRIVEQDFSKNSVWKAVELAMTCVFQVSSKRPNMTQILIELKQCLAMEMAGNNNNEVNESSVIDVMSVITEGGPMAR